MCDSSKIEIEWKWCKVQQTLQLLPVVVLSA